MATAAYASATTTTTAGARLNKRAVLSTPNRLIFERWDTLPNDARVKAQVVAAITGLGLSTLWLHSGEGRFPPPMRSNNITAWRVGDVRDWFAGRWKPASAPTPEASRTPRAMSAPAAPSEASGSPSVPLAGVSATAAAAPVGGQS